MESRTDTIAAISTAPGRGGVAVVRISGPDAWAIAGKVTGRHIVSSDAGRFFHTRFADADDGLMLVFKAPRSYTGEDAIELQGHGGVVAPRRVLEACLAAGARLARRGEFTERAFLNGKLDLSSAEAVIDLVDATTDRAAADAFARLGGALSRPFEKLYAAAIELSGRLEHALDFSEDELPPGFAEDATAALSTLRAGVERLIATAHEGRLLREGALVVLVGAPNAGKSSLMNALLNTDRAIVNAAAGTTRDSIEEGMQIGGWPVRLTDTAGLRDAADAVEAEGVARAQELIGRAELVLALDCDIPGALRIHAKCDLDSGAADVMGLPVSAKTGYGLDALKAAIAGRLDALAAEGAEENGADVTVRQKELLAKAAAALADAETAVDWAVAANDVRTAAEHIGQIIGKTYSDDLLDAIFSRFCVGK
jgi:tRNA modification GTPase